MPGLSVVMASASGFVADRLRLSVSSSEAEKVGVMLLRCAYAAGTATASAASAIQPAAAGTLGRGRAGVNRAGRAMGQWSWNGAQAEPAATVAPESPCP